MHTTDGRALTLVTEHKLADLIGGPPGGGVLEASGVATVAGAHFVVFDNLRRVARIGAGLAATPGANRWMGKARAGEGYEDIAYSVHLRRFYLLVEADKHPDGTYKGAIDEFDVSWRHKGRRWVDFTFAKRNRGFEGLVAMRWQGVDYLLALCESRKGNIQVLRREGRTWHPVAEVDLPPLGFKDHSAIALRGRRLALVSQKSSRLWIGTLRPRDWSIAGHGRIYDLPRTGTGKRLYCTLEGVDWLSDSTLVMVSDLKKRAYPDRCARTDQSIHVFRLPRG